MRKNIFILCLFLFCFSWVDRSYAFDDLAVQTTRQPGAKLSFQTLNESKVLVSVLNEEGEAVLGLTKQDFQIKQGPKTAEILSVEDVTEQRDTGLNIVLVVDNSYSMKQRGAIDPVLAALNEFLSLIRPIDDVHVITFVDPRNGGTLDSDQPRVSTRVTRGNDPALLGMALRDSYIPDQTAGTYLYDAMRKGLEIVRDMPEKSQKFMIVFSDGEDINSTVKPGDLDLAVRGLSNFVAFAVDYMDRPGLDPFLQSFAQGNHGLIRKARSASDFLPIFQQFSTTIFHRYAVTYRFLNPPKGAVSLAPSTINIEEVTVVDSSPLLNYIYFETGKSEIPERYNLFPWASDTEDFSEEKLAGTMEKYHQVLNVLGKRLVVNPEARINIVGCNSNTGEEKGKMELSRNRAFAVFSYFKDVWGIDPARMEVKVQNLPTVASTARVPEGVIENQRVEIYSDHPAILDTINSTYMQAEMGAGVINVAPAIEAETVIKNWKITLFGGDKELTVWEGKGEMPARFTYDVAPLGIDTVAALGKISADVEVSDNEGNVFRTSADEPVRINFIRREERLAQKLESKVIEKYGLILFEFDRSDLKDRNQVIVNRVITRMAALPSAQMNISGHTDIIGKEEYNIDLSGRRASAVYGAMLETGMAVGSQITHEGLGPNNPPYDNSIPEGRALNRTVIITLTYTE
ncbi:MAG: OmpA family protein [Deltaproteobacteria bacterium]|nr:OmpA family protein [Deltaproteobacteria bacterium]